MISGCVRMFSLAAILAACPMGFAQSASELLEKGIYTEETAGDLDAAIGIYEQIVENHDSNHTYVARAQFRLGVCYLKKGLEEEAAAAFRKVVDRYPNDKDVVAEARVRLTNLGFGTNGETLAMSTRQVWAPAPALDNMGKPSPDGRYLSYINGDTGNVAVHNIETGENRDITDEGKLPLQRGLFPIWSPDSRQVAYIWAMGNSTGISMELRIVELDGSEPRVLSDSVPFYLSDSVPFKDGHAPWPKAWSQDGQYILGLLGTKDDNSEFGHNHHIVLVSVDDGSQRIFNLSSYSRGVGMETQMSLSPDGRYAAFDLQLWKDPETRDICLLATEGSGDAAVVKIEHPADDWAPLWTPDGKRIVFASDRTGSPGLWMLEMDEGKPNGAPRLLKEMGKNFSPMEFALDGSLYYHLETGRSNATVYVASVDFKAGKVLAQPVNIPMHFEGTNAWPTYSPDGNYLAYASERGERGDGNVLVIRSLETGESRDLSPKSLQMFGRLTWAPDGRSILVRGRVDNKMGLRLVDVQTGNFSTIFEFPQGKPPRERPVFSKDGKEIYYALHDLSAIVAYNLETHEEKILYQSKTKINGLDNISPDGRTLAFSESYSVDVIRPSIVKTISTSGGEPTDVYPMGTEDPNIRGFQWTNEGDLVVLENTDDEQHSLLIFPKEGGDHRRIELGFKVNRYEMHPDGQRIVFHLGELNQYPRQEIWVLENFLPESNAGE